GADHVSGSGVEDLCLLRGGRGDHVARAVGGQGRVVGVEAGQAGVPQLGVRGQVEGRDVVQVAAGDVERAAVGGDGRVVDVAVAALDRADRLVAGEPDGVDVDLEHALRQVRDDVDGAQVGEGVAVDDADRAGLAVADHQHVAQARVGGRPRRGGQRGRG